MKIVKCTEMVKYINSSFPNFIILLEIQLDFVFWPFIMLTGQVVQAIPDSVDKNAL